jgi:tetratricopeptide (TPR) repeat protein
MPSFVEDFLERGYSAFAACEVARVEDGVEHLETALAAEEEPARRARMLTALADLAVRQDRWDRARRALEEAQDLCDRHGFPDLDVLLLTRQHALASEDVRSAGGLGLRAVRRLEVGGRCLLPWHEWGELGGAAAPEVEAWVEELRAALPAEDGEAPPDLAERLGDLRSRVEEAGVVLDDPVALLQVLPEVFSRLGRMPRFEARMLALALRKRLAIHEQLGPLRHLEGQLAWVQGSLAGSSGALEEAVEAFERALALLGGPEDFGGRATPVTLLTQCADCLLELDKLDEAERRYLEARHHSSCAESDGFAIAWGLGRVHFFQERWAEAFRELRRARKAFDHAEPRWIGRDPEATDGYVSLGHLGSDLDEMIDEAKEELQREVT